MANVLVVDDQPNVVDGILAGVDWYLIGVEHVYEAYSLAEAKEVIRSNPVDLLVSDIEMPFGSGLELLRWVRDENYDIECIFLTSHPEFSYAQQAISMGSLNYLIQPVDYGELEKAIASAAQTVREKQKEKTYIAYGHMWEDENIEENIWRNILFGVIPPRELETADFLSELSERYQIAVAKDARYYLVLFVLSEPAEINEDVRMQEKRLLAEALGYEEGRIVRVGEGKWVTVLRTSCPGLTLQELTMKCRMIAGACDRRLGREVSCYIGAEAAAAELSTEYDRLMKRDEENIEHYRGVFSDRVTWDERAEGAAASMEREMARWKKELIDGNDRKKVAAELEAFISRSREEKRIDRKFLELFQQKLVSCYFSAMKARGEEGMDLFGEENLYARLFTGRKTADELIAFSKDLVLYGTVDPAVAESSEHYIEFVKNYIKENLAEDLSRDNLAAKVFLSPSYLSRQFRKWTGETLNDYIYKERMKQAEILLTDTSLPIALISAECGYSNFAYFSQMFKKMYDLSPSEFRQASRREADRR